MSDRSGSERWAEPGVAHRRKAIRIPSPECPAGAPCPVMGGPHTPFLGHPSAIREAEGADAPKAQRSGTRPPKHSTTYWKIRKISVEL